MLKYFTLTMIMKALQFLYCAYATLIFYLVWNPLILALFAVYRLIGKFNYASFNFTLRLMHLLMFKVIHIKGKKNIDKHKSYIIYFNHSSIMDAGVIALLSPNKLAWVASEKSINFPVYSIFFKFSDFIPVLEDKINRIAVFNKHFERVLKSAKSIGIAPEGGRTPDGTIKDFNKGVVYMINFSKLDILPVTINGYYTFKSKFRKYINPNVRLELVIHPPIKNSIYKFKNKKFVLVELKSIIEKSYYLGKGRIR